MDACVGAGEFLIRHQVRRTAGELARFASPLHGGSCIDTIEVIKRALEESRRVCRPRVTARQGWLRVTAGGSSGDQPGRRTGGLRLAVGCASGGAAMNSFHRRS